MNIKIKQTKSIIILEGMKKCIFSIMYLIMSICYSREYYIKSYLHYNRWKIYILIIIAFCTFSSCKNRKSDVANILIEWIGKEVRFDKKHVFTYQGEDTVNFSISKEQYKILIYTDSTGCMACNLQLNEWSKWIKEMDSVFKNKVAFLFFMHPRSVSDMKFMLKTQNFTYPICIDEKNEINNINHFPTQRDLQTFLLDENNKVLAMGNPIHNPKVKELYLNIITGNNFFKKEKVSKTKIQLTRQNIDLGTFDWKKEQNAQIVIKNIGKIPLVINDVITSCGCVRVEFDNTPVLSEKSVSMEVFYKAEHPEYFLKTIRIYCNVENSPLQLKITGNAK